MQRAYTRVRKKDPTSISSFTCFWNSSLFLTFHDSYVLTFYWYPELISAGFLLLSTEYFDEHINLGGYRWENWVWESLGKLENGRIVMALKYIWLQGLHTQQLTFIFMEQRFSGTSYFHVFLSHKNSSKNRRNDT